ncbi:DNA translocase FtsK [Parabacteroides sp. AM58-2XD]|uniref:FtsK/SpoIIIE family DNA translocase n=1 Tax=Parabacteroides TaxID=375288 RepID=UPI000FE18EA7|nr:MULTISPECIES: DNA translocase FtsK [Parabacteroides]RGY94733.1 DNA translocase FtsK [Parabacteroides sp. AM58-2XD]GKG76379.1 DNA translocase FtsK [Parabacteroides goldsteinii]GKG80213.1 DNA translocase FtsK [Parabacteroides goldsteinii]
MAKKATTTKQNNNNEPGKFAMMKMFFTNERTRFITGLVIAIVTIYIGLALISFFFTGGADQSKIENVPLADLLTNRGSVENWTGVRGAVLADLLMNRWFGISSFMILFFLGSVGAKLMNLRRVSLLKRFLFCAAMLIWGSMFFAFVFISGYEDTFIYLGGQHGYYLSEMMITNVGIPGTILLLAGVFLIIAIFSSKRTIPFLQSILSFGWLKNRLKREKKEVSEEEDINEDDEEEEEVADQVVTDQPDERPETEEFVFDTEKEIETARKEESRKKTEVYSTISHDDAFEVTVPQEEEVYDAPNAENQPDEPEDLPGDPRFTVEVPAGDDEVYDASSLGEYDPKLDLSNFRNPPIELLKKYDVSDHQVDMEEQMANQKRIKQTLESFGISIASIKATVGPTITLYEVIPDTGVRISKIKNLEDDIALNLSALGIRIIAPMPGKGTIGIEVPNKDPQIVSMQSVVASRKFQESKYDLPVVLGKTITNEIFMFDLCKMPHLLVAGATGQGKSVGLNAVITSLLYRKHPSELKFVMVDPKMVEFGIYSDLERHYLAKLPDADKAVITDCTKVIMTLNSVCKEMDDRYELLMKAHVRNIKEYNAKFISRHLNPEKGHKFMPFIVVIIDEFGDLIMQAGKEIETPIARIAQKARAVGIHMIIATQRPSTNIITGIIKANFPARMAFRVMQMVDSRTILDAPGANQLIGRGDLLFSQGGDTNRVQCAFVDTPEVEQIVNFISGQAGYPTAFLLPEYVGEGGEDKAPGSVDLSDRDPLFDEAARLIVIQQQGSTSLIQRKFAIGYNRAGRLMDQLEAAGIVGPFEGSKARQVLIQDEYNLEQLLNSLK